MRSKYDAMSEKDVKILCFNPYLKVIVMVHTSTTNPNDIPTGCLLYSYPWPSRIDSKQYSFSHFYFFFLFCSKPH